MQNLLAMDDLKLKFLDLIRNQVIPLFLFYLLISNSSKSHMNLQYAESG